MHERGLLLSCSLVNTFGVLAILDHALRDRGRATHTSGMSVGSEFAHYGWRYCPF